MKLQDKVIVIIGGTSGLGAAAVAACHTAGARIIATGRDQKKCRTLQDQFSDRCKTFALDATLDGSAEQAVAVAVQHFGRLDGLYHVAGGSGRAAGDGPLHQINTAGWQQTLDWNLTSVFYSNRAAVQQFLRQGSGGSILNMTSVLATHPAPAYFATHAYAAAKAAIVGLTRACAAHYGPQNIRFNALAPALVDTPMAQRAAGDPAIMEFIRHKQPLDGGRIGKADDLDQAVIYFLSDDSSFVTGQVLAVDGGWSVTDAGAAPAS